MRGRLGLVDWWFMCGLALVLGVPLLVSWLPVDPRLVSALLGAVAAGGLFYRFFVHFPETQAAGRFAAFLLIATLILSAVGSYQLNGVAPLTDVTYPLIGHRVACILLALWWPKWLGTRSIFSARK